MPAYAAIRALGRGGIAEMVTRCHELADGLADKLRRDSDVRIPNQVVYNQVLIDCAPSHLDDGDVEQFVRRVIAAIRDEGTCWVGGTHWHGRAMLRVSVANRSTTPDDIDRSAKAILSAVSSVTDDLNAGLSEGAPV